MELPPRTRRIPAQLLRAYRIRGTTSAHAENTTGSPSDTCGQGNYLRARGEYGACFSLKGCCMELPPRTRRIPAKFPLRSPHLGTTSAHAENTVGPLNSFAPERNYLRARGEYWKVKMLPGRTVELPPRTRRIRLIRLAINLAMGTTSAHAENTLPIELMPHFPRNYLRARGEYCRQRPRSWPAPELPPRTRRILTSTLPKAKKIGTTSAHAENTIINELHATKNRNYLRARGEYSAGLKGFSSCMELPPRTRRIPEGQVTYQGLVGTTSAHAENTFTLVSIKVCSGNYLRARGEYIVQTHFKLNRAELPPRTRRIRCCPTEL